MLPKHLSSVNNIMSGYKYPGKLPSNSPERIAEIKRKFNLHHGKGKRKKKNRR